MSRILLLGAGFSRNWGGFLAAEMFDQLLMQPEVSGYPALKKILWNHKDAGGFENALSQVQQDFRANPTSPLYRGRVDRLQAAINRIFSDMDLGFAARVGWDFQNDRGRTLLTTLIKFDAIFTVNEDLLFERFYSSTNLLLETRQRLSGWITPGVREQRADAVPYNPAQSRWTPAPPAEFVVPDKFQPYFKLHGSWRWFDADGQQLMIMGGSKATAINGYPVLAWYRKEFERRLGSATKLMVIGYGFHDFHINETILKAAAGGGLKMFVIDTAGLGVTHTYPDKALKGPNPFADIIAGGSSRGLNEIFGSDTVAHIAISRFLDD